MTDACTLTLFGQEIFEIPLGFLPGVFFSVRRMSAKCLFKVSVYDEIMIMQRGPANKKKTEEIP